MVELNSIKNEIRQVDKQQLKVANKYKLWFKWIWIYLKAGFEHGRQLDSSSLTMLDGAIFCK